MDLVAGPARALVAVLAAGREVARALARVRDQGVVAAVAAKVAGLAVALAGVVADLVAAGQARVEVDRVLVEVGPAAGVAVAGLAREAGVAGVAQGLVAEAAGVEAEEVDLVQAADLVQGAAGRVAGMAQALGLGGRVQAADLVQGAAVLVLVLVLDRVKEAEVVAGLDQVRAVDQEVGLEAGLVQDLVVVMVCALTNGTSDLAPHINGNCFGPPAPT